jgi:2-polyprenylphenol 6-hydroxylase
MDADVIIVGGGLAGVALAVALRKTSLSVALVETQPPRRTSGEAWDARIYAISPANARFLDEIGIWQHLDRSRLQAVERMDISGDADGRLSFSAYDSGVSELAWICESSLLHAELWETVKRQANVTLHCPARPQAVSITPDEAQLTLADGRTLTGRLLVGADGVESWVRQSLGVTVVERPYGQLGVVANFATEREHQQTASQWFQGDDVLAYLPLPGRHISVVWSVPQAKGRELMSLNADDFTRALETAGEQRLGRLELLAPPSAFPLRLMRASRVVQPRLALIGDAAHAIHPLSGHGVNLGFQDAASLAQVLSGKPDHIDAGALSLLRAHERARKEEVLALQTVTDGLHRLFRAPADPASPWQALRNAGMRMTDKLPVVKDLLVRYALAS